ncbi:hypothetical protein QZH41_017309 [Actinostola sp. cb2023]|nr:hypothetical protein QZH41_017309 [Actinostola sp. cb2023]
MQAIGPMKKSKLGYDDIDDDFGHGMYSFNPSGFPMHRQEKESSLLSSSSQHLGGLYGAPSGMQSPGQSNFYGSGPHNTGMPPSSMQGPPSSQRGLSSIQNQPYNRSLSMPATSHGMSSVSASGMPNVQSSSSIHTMVGAPGMNSNSSQLGSVSNSSASIAGFPLSRSQSTSNSQVTVGSGLQSLSSAFTPTGSDALLRDQMVGRLPSPPGRRQPFQSASVFRDFRQGGRYGENISPGGSALDLSEFPALANRMLDSSGSGSAPSRPSYGVVSKPAEPQPDFSILNEDFPALPGSGFTKQGENSDVSSQQEATKSLISSLVSHSLKHLDTETTVMTKGCVEVPLILIFCLLDSSRINTSYEQALKDSTREIKLDAKLTGQLSNKPQRGIQTSPSVLLNECDPLLAPGMITNIPKGMVTDQFGMIGLLTFIRAAETEPNLVTLALGSDLTTLGLNLNSPESLYHTFGSPFADSPCRPHEIDYHVPPDYRINSYIKEKLAPIKLSRYSEDLLFHLYYTNGGDILQLAAAAELYARDWRYHKDERAWLTRAPGVEPQIKSTNYERGTYYFFDCNTWKKVPREFHLEYDKLEEKPTLQPVAAQ